MVEYISITSMAEGEQIAFNPDKKKSGIPSKEDLSLLFEQYDALCLDDHLPPVILTGEELLKVQKRAREIGLDSNTLGYPFERSEIFLPDLSDEDIQRVYSQTYFHGTKGDPETIKKTGFTFDATLNKGMNLRTSDGQLKVSGHFSYITTDYPYALDYANGNDTNVLRIKVNEGSKLERVNFQKIDHLVQLRIVPSVKKLTTEMYDGELSDEKLRFFADEAVNKYLLGLGIDASLTGSNNDKSNELTVVNQSILTFL